MLSVPAEPGPDIRPMRHWKPASAADAAALIRPATTVGIGWLGDALAAALADRFLARAQPYDLTVVYAETRHEGRNHGLNLLAHEGLVRRVIGGQWHPVPALQALAAANRIEAYNLPAGLIKRLFRAIAEGSPGRGGPGSFADPPDGGNRLNRRTREQLVSPAYPASDETLPVPGFRIDAALVGVAVMAGTGAITMTPEARTLSQAARKSGGIVIAQLERHGTLDKLPPGQLVVPDASIDVLVMTDPRVRVLETFSSARIVQNRQRPRLTH